jgi:type I restriction enzyme S subunit
MTELPSGWRLATLNDLQSDEPRAITDGPFGSNLTRAHYTASGPRVVRLQNIGDGVFNDARAHISEAHFESLRAHEVVPGDLLVASLGEVLPRACIAPAYLGPAIVKADCIRVRLSQGVDPRWVMYSMQRPQVRSWADDHRHGVGRPRLGLKVIRQIPVPLPPLDEQRRIVDVLEDHLSRLDAADSSLTASAYPADWKRSTVEEAGKVGLGRQRHPDWHAGPNMHPYLRVANVFEDRIDLGDVMQMHWPDNSFERFRLKQGDVLLNEGQSPEFLGRPALFRGEPVDIAFTNTLIRFQANDNVLPEFALLVFRRHMHAGRFAQESRITTNIAHLSASRLKPIEFPLPPQDEQKRLVGLAEQQLGAASHLGDQVRLLELRKKALRRSLLRAAFSGRLTGRSSDMEMVEEMAGV